MSIVSFINQSQRGLFNYLYFNYVDKQTEQSSVRNSFQETQYATDMLSPFEIRIEVPTTTNEGTFEFPSNLEHLTQLGLKVIVNGETVIKPVQFVRHNDLNVMLNSNFIAPVIAENDFKIVYTTEVFSGNRGLRIYPQATTGYDLVVDYLRMPTDLVVADLSDNNASLEFIESAHDKIVKKAIALYLMSLGDLTSATAEDKETYSGKT